MAAIIDLSGKTAVVTGGGRGLGGCIALELAKAGADVWIGDIVEENAANMSKQIKDVGVKSGYCVGDVVEENTTKVLIDEAYKATGRFDIMISAAGFIILEDFLKMSEKDIRKLLDINLMGSIHADRNAMKKMIETKTKGRIVNISSIAGRTNMGDPFAWYCVSKAAVVSLTQGAAKYGSQYDINVNAIMPGIIRTDMWEKILDFLTPEGGNRDEVFQTNLNNLISQKRAQEPIDMAWLALYFCGPSGNNVTGQCVHVDGGCVMA